MSIAHEAARRCMRALHKIAPQLRGTRRLAHMVTPVLARAGSVRAQCYGRTFELNLHDHVDELIFWEQYETRTLALWQKVVKPGDVVFDVGANVGLFSLLAATNGATVYAFEPNPPTRQRLQRNVELNTASVVIDARALSDTESTTMLFDDFRPVSGAHNSGVASLSNANAGGRGTAIQTTTIDRVVAERGLERLDWMKMDIQGAELLALRGARATLAAMRPRIIMELDPKSARNMGWSERDLRAFFDELGYTFRPLETINILAEPSGAPSA